jgi:ferredoxin
MVLGDGGGKSAVVTLTDRRGINNGIGLPPAMLGITIAPVQHVRTDLQTGGIAMAKRVVIDSEECVGCQTCVELCPDVFSFNDASEKAEVIKEEGGPEDCIEEAMSSCPVECIKWEED